MSTTDYLIELIAVVDKTIDPDPIQGYKAIYGVVFVQMVVICSSIELVSHNNSYLMILAILQLLTVYHFGTLFDIARRRRIYHKQKV